MNAFRTTSVPVKHAHGFTVVELVIVIVVIMIMAAYASFDSSPAELSLPSQADKLASDLRSAQMQAYTSGSATRFSIDTSEETYTIERCSKYAGETCETWTLTLSGKIDKSVQLSKLSGDDVLTFTSLGKPKAGASYQLEFGGSKKIIRVNAETGHISVSSS